ncbi:hypothetical protein COT72_02010 [archaeon CG10_big_fil_rev_8_21_14_0_10_43_11]|nr:MAG: hypothetical protein COT72_02010 [archaeon CG10_big_fil_rev_8_21_14_0_10_43_11]
MIPADLLETRVEMWGERMLEQLEKSLLHDQSLDSPVSAAYPALRSYDFLRQSIDNASDVIVSELNITQQDGAAYFSARKKHEKPLIGRFRSFKKDELVESAIEYITTVVGGFGSGSLAIAREVQHTVLDRFKPYLSAPESPALVPFVFSTKTTFAQTIKNPLEEIDFFDVLPYRGCTIKPSTMRPCCDGPYLFSAVNASRGTVIDFGQKSMVIPSLMHPQSVVTAFATLLYVAFPCEGSCPKDIGPKVAQDVWNDIIGKKQVRI